MGPVMEAKGTVTNEILEMIEDDPRVCYINADGTGRGGRVQQAQLRYPDRILDGGIQEMNMVTIAAGLAKEGFLPYVQTFGPFLCVRALDQIHNDVAYNDYPVRLIGTHAGLSSGYGPTHNTIIEFGVMNSLPNMTMVAPCDAEQCKKLLRKSLNYPKPIYIRIPRGEEPLLSLIHILLFTIFCDMGMYDWDLLLDTYNTIGHPFGAHPNHKRVKGIEVSTGSLGHGLAWCCGIGHANRGRGIKSRIWTLLGVCCVLGGVILLAKGDDTCKESNSSTAST